MKKINKIEIKNGYLMPEGRAYVNTVDKVIIEKLNEIIDLINKPVETTNEQPKDIYQKQREFLKEVNIKDLESCTTLEAIQLFSDYLNKLG
jgi:uncharacterized protein YoxC